MSYCHEKFMISVQYKSEQYNILNRYSLESIGCVAVHFKVCDILKCKNCLIGFLDELDNFEQKNFLHFKM